MSSHSALAPSRTRDGAAETKPPPYPPPRQEESSGGRRVSAAALSGAARSAEDHQNLAEAQTENLGRHLLVERGRSQVGSLAFVHRGGYPASRRSSSLFLSAYRLPGFSLPTIEQDPGRGRTGNAR